MVMEIGGVRDRRAQPICPHLIRCGNLRRNHLCPTVKATGKALQRPDVAPLLRPNPDIAGVADLHALAAAFVPEDEHTLVKPRRPTANPHPQPGALIPVRLRIALLAKDNRLAIAAILIDLADGLMVRVEFIL